MTRTVRLDISMCAAVLSFAGLFAVPTSVVAQSIKLAPKSMPAIGIVDERYQSYNIEMLEVTGGRFWAPYKAQSEAPPDTKQPTPGNMPASLYRYRAPINLANPQLRKLAAALGPAYVRVSGTWANSTYFQDSDGPAPATPPTGFNGVLTRQQWRGVIDFAHAVNADLVSSFAISQGVRDANGVWTPVEAEKLLNFTKAAGGTIVAAEMFNEPTFAAMGGAPKGYDAAAYARDFHAFHAFIKKADPSLTVLGPGGVGEAGSLGELPGMQLIKSEDILKEEGPGLDAFSYHFYGGVSKRCGMMGAAAQTSPETALSDAWLSRTNRDEEFYAALRDKYVPGKPLWLTETGETACGGNPWASDFIDSFRYLNQLGTLAKHGVKVVMHNTLAASDYALLDETTLTTAPQLLVCRVVAASDGHHGSRCRRAGCTWAVSLRALSARAARRRGPAGDQCGQDGCSETDAPDFFAPLQPDRKRPAGFKGDAEWRRIESRFEWRSASDRGRARTCRRRITGRGKHHLFRDSRGKEPGMPLRSFRE